MNESKIIIITTKIAQHNSSLSIASCLNNDQYLLNQLSEKIHWDCTKQLQLHHQFAAVHMSNSTQNLTLQWLIINIIIIIIILELWLGSDPNFNNIINFHTIKDDVTGCFRILFMPSKNKFFLGDE